MLKHGVSWENLKRGLRNPFLLFDEVVLQHLYRVPSAALNSRIDVGTNVFSREWDVLILLDTCRVDALRAVADEYDFLEDVEPVRSTGGATPEWTAKTFVSEYLDDIRRTAYLSATAQTRGILEERLPVTRTYAESHLAYKLLAWYDTVDVDDLGHVEYLFKYEPKGESGPYGHPGGLTPPRYVTERGVAVGRTGDYDRMIVHYMQPHSPYVANAIREDRELRAHEPRPMKYLRETGDFDAVWGAYLDELRYVLDDVAVLLENLDAETVAISADHGEAFGEYGIYGHQIGSLHPKVRTVPWAETTATDSHTLDPTVEDPDESATVTDPGTEDQLKSLGYKF